MGDMRRHKWKSKPKVRCEWTEEYDVYGYYESAQCRAPAVYRGWSEYWDGWQPNRDRVLLCEHHAREFQQHDDRPTIYRFR